MRHPLLPTLLALCLILPVHAQANADSNSAPAEPLRQPLVERSESGAEALQQQLPPAEQQTLQAEQVAFLALWKPANAPQARGIVILLPGAGESADWPRVIQPLRARLPDIGWSSLSLTLPDSLPAPLPEAVLPQTPLPGDNPAETAEQNSASDGNAQTEGAAAPQASGEAPATPPADPAARILARIQAGIAFAEQQDAREIVLLGHGEGAYWASLYLKEQPDSPIRRLVIIDPRQPASQSLASEALIPGLKLATGDFFYKDQASDRSQALRRKQSSQRLAHGSYVQVALKALPGNQEAEQEQLFRRVRGWLEKTGPASAH